MLLHSASKDDELGGSIFQICDQINYGIQHVQPSMQVDIAKLNIKAGSRAMDLSDYKTATSYLNNALKLLPKNHWTSHYGICLQLFYSKAKSAYSCGNKEDAYQLLKKILDKGCCIKDKLDAHYLYVSVSVEYLY